MRSDPSAAVMLKLRRQLSLSSAFAMEAVKNLAPAMAEEEEHRIHGGFRQFQQGLLSSLLPEAAGTAGAASAAASMFPGARQQKAAAAAAAVPAAAAAAPATFARSAGLATGDDDVAERAESPQASSAAAAVAAAADAATDAAASPEQLPGSTPVALLSPAGDNLAMRNLQVAVSTRAFLKYLDAMTRQDQAESPEHAAAMIKLRRSFTVLFSEFIPCACACHACCMRLVLTHTVALPHRCPPALLQRRAGKDGGGGGVRRR